MKDVKKQDIYHEYFTTVGFFAAINCSNATQSGFKSDENDATDT
jgi:hypothetical protein